MLLLCAIRLGIEYQAFCSSLVSNGQEEALRTPDYQLRLLGTIFVRVFLSQLFILFFLGHEYTDITFDQTLNYTCAHSYSQHF